MTILPSSKSSLAPASGGDNADYHQNSKLEAQLR